MQRNYKQTLEFLGIPPRDSRPNSDFVEKLRQATGMRLKDAYIINAILAEVDRVGGDLVNISDMLDDIKFAIEQQAILTNKPDK